MECGLFWGFERHLDTRSVTATRGLLLKSSAPSSGMAPQRREQLLEVLGRNGIEERGVGVGGRHSLDHVVILNQRYLRRLRMLQPFWPDWAEI